MVKPNDESEVPCGALGKVTSQTKNPMELDLDNACRTGDLPTGTKLKIQLAEGKTYLTICEIEVFRKNLTEEAAGKTFF